MKTLFVTGNNVPYAPVTGGQAASLSVLRMYAELGTVDLVALAESTEASVDTSALQAICRRVVLVPTPLLLARHPMYHFFTVARAILTGASFKLLKARVRALENVLRNLASGENWDIVHYEGVDPAQFDHLFASSHRILLEQNVEWEIFERHARHQQFLPLRLFAAIEAQRLRSAAVESSGQVDLVLALSDRDRDIFASAGYKTQLATLRLPVEVPDTPPSTFEQTKPVIASVGNLTNLGRRHATFWFHDRVWPRVRELMPDAEWRIIGANPPRASRSLDGSNGIHVLGFVHDIEGSLRDVRACVIPLQIGGGIRIKILHMLALGIPCITTSVGVQGIGVRAGRDLLVADDPLEFADAVVRVLQDRVVHQRLAENGRRFIAQYHTPEACQAAFGRLLAPIMHATFGSNLGSELLERS